MSPVTSTIDRRVLLVCLAAAASIAMTGAQAAEVTFAIRIENGHVAETMRLIRVKQGDAVRLRWSSDRRMTLHLHGYDIEKVVEPGSIADLAFTARVEGRFPIHVHAADARAGNPGHEEAPLVTIEVYPR
jgi:hypothetical protein